MIPKFKNFEYFYNSFCFLPIQYLTRIMECQENIAVRTFDESSFQTVELIINYFAHELLIEPLLTFLFCSCLLFNLYLELVGIQLVKQVDRQLQGTMVVIDAQLIVNTVLLVDLQYPYQKESLRLLNHGEIINTVLLL